MSSENLTPVNKGVASKRSVAVAVKSLSKFYRIYDRPSDRLKQFLLPRLSVLFGIKPKEHFREFWALRDVSFEVARGEVVGIVGRNGSGKSTLLQLICGTLTPTGGEVETQGRVAALLELGSGFNPEFSGRDNVYMNAAVLGMSRAETDARFSAIEEFADIGNFIDQPVRTYSSGMAVRLAFSVAVCVDPSILIVDEALSVGDELFQRKCFSRIEQLRSRGVTILFVSHAGGTVIELCDRAILIDAGNVLMQGDPKRVIAYYHKLLYAPGHLSEQIRAEIADAHFRPLQSGIDGVDGSPNAEGNSLAVASVPSEETFEPNFIPKDTLSYEGRGALISNVRILTVGGSQVNGLIRGREYLYCYDVAIDDAVSGVRFGMLIKSTSGVHLGGSMSEATIHEGIALRRGDVARVEFSFRCLLNPGVYFMNAGVFGCRYDEELLLHRIADAAVFRVLPVVSNTAQELVDFECVARVRVDG
jgi:lipopolysaccharide transport system ATP-binding protein